MNGSGSEDAFVVDIDSVWVDRRCAPALSLESGEAWRDVPASAGVVTLHHEASEDALAVLATADLRGMVRRRLEKPEGEVVDRARWLVCDSAGEAELLQAAVAKSVMPGRWRGLLGKATAWFVGIELEASTPRFEVMPAHAATEFGSLVLGPLISKRTASDLVRHLDELFDPYSSKCMHTTTNPIAMKNYRYISIGNGQERNVTRRFKAFS
ncbi:MAG: hypothetical protein AAGB34_09065, partial [Planctomycetota bacterium]